MVKNASHIDYVLGYCYDLYIFCETWLTSSHVLSSLLCCLCSGYHVLRCDRVRKQGGGVIIFIRNSFGYTEVYSESVPDSYEMLAVDILFDCYKVRLIAVYRTPSCSTASNESLVNTLSDIVSCEHPSIITDISQKEGDLCDTR